MQREDWLLGASRRDAAVERIYQAAADVIAREGEGALDVAVIAERVHCSRATVYRLVGGRAAIKDAVLMRSAAKIVDSVGRGVEGRSGADRVVTAVVVALSNIRADPLMVASLRASHDTAWFLNSPAVRRLAIDLNGLTGDDTEGADWIIRILLALLYWPMEDLDAERRMLRRVLDPDGESP